MQDDLIHLLAGRRGHFAMESGFHSELWFELDHLFAEPDKLRPFIAELARRIAHHRVEILCGPMTGGARLAAEMGALLGVPAIAVERIEPPPGNEVRLFSVRYVVPTVDRSRVRGARVAVVDDAISAGSAVRGTLADLAACGAQPVALGALFVFGDKAAPLAAQHSLALETIARLSFGLWPPDACPLCAAGAPVEKVSDTPPP